MHRTQQSEAFELASLSKLRFFRGHDPDINSYVLISFLQKRFHHMSLSHTHIYICHASHILWKNLQMYNIEGTIQQEMEHKTKMHDKI